MGLLEDAQKATAETQAQQPVSLLARAQEAAPLEPPPIELTDPQRPIIDPEEQEAIATGAQESHS